ncbi:MAG TPA: hypothetical protein VK536_02930 [Candidatus Limnocylindrales bacterium]|nr:hypothetical protein [Candidatus Limnocylindrales bacterium]
MENRVEIAVVSIVAIANGMLIRIMVGYLRGMNMPTARVDSKNRIVIDKQTRSATQIKAGDTVILVPLDKHSFKVETLNFTGRIEDDPAWRAFHPPAKIKKHVPPKKLEEYMEETMWEE